MPWRKGAAGATAQSLMGLNFYAECKTAECKAGRQKEARQAPTRLPGQGGALAGQRPFGSHVGMYVALLNKALMLR